MCAVPAKEAVEGAGAAAYVGNRGLPEETNPFRFSREAIHLIGAGHIQPGQTLVLGEGELNLRVPDLLLRCLDLRAKVLRLLQRLGQVHVVGDEGRVLGKERRACEVSGNWCQDEIEEHVLRVGRAVVGDDGFHFALRNPGLRLGHEDLRDDAYIVPHTRLLQQVLGRLEAFLFDPLPGPSCCQLPVGALDLGHEVDESAAEVLVGDVPRDTTALDRDIGFVVDEILEEGERELALPLRTPLGLQRIDR